MPHCVHAEALPLLSIHLARPQLLLGEGQATAAPDSGAFARTALPGRAPGACGPPYFCALDLSTLKSGLFSVSLAISASSSDGATLPTSISKTLKSISISNLRFSLRSFTK